MKSFAKINLGLKIFKKNKNESKHKIDSIFVLYKKLYDNITIKKSTTLSIKYFINNKPVEIKDCLVTKALNYLHSKYFWNINYSIVIKKNIPIGGGLGGASSNAASVMNYILQKNKAMGLNLKEIANSLGSDMPFFLTNYKTARVKNYGDIVVKQHDIKLKLKLVKTNIIIKTKDIFELLEKDLKYKSIVNIDQIYNDLYLKHQLVYNQMNDLTPYILKSNKQLKQTFQKQQTSFFTGAGSTIIQVYEQYK